LADRLVDAVSLDLDNLLPQHPNLSPGLDAVINDLLRQWEKNFGDLPTEDHSKGLETATTEASRLLLVAVAEAFAAIQIHTGTALDRVQLERQQPPPDVPSCKMDHSLKRISVSVGKPYTIGVENKRPIGFSSVLTELFRRANCGVLDTEIVDVFEQPKWWIVANKVCSR
jgi:hypothetical protein